MKKPLSALGFVALAASCFTAGSAVGAATHKSNGTIVYDCAHAGLSHSYVWDRPGFVAECTATVAGKTVAGRGGNGFWALVTLTGKICRAGEHDVKGLAYRCDYVPYTSTPRCNATPGF